MKKTKLGEFEELVLLAVAALQQDAYRPGPSLLAKQLVLDACLEGLDGVYGRMQPREARAVVAASCLDQADAIAAEVPSSGYAAFVGARAAAEVDDMAGFNRRLLASQLTLVDMNQANATTKRMCRSMMNA